MYAVILAGGGGTRLWPLSRPERPKPFLPLLGDETLIQRTAARIAPLLRDGDLFCVTDRRYGQLVRDQIPDAGLIVEPNGRNTAAAIALATVAIDRPEDEVMLVLPADHWIEREDVFRDVVSAAVDRLANGAFGIDEPLVTMGIQPDRPATDYGYLRPDTMRSTTVQGVRAYPLIAFEEKPNEHRAPGADQPAGRRLERRDVRLAARRDPGRDREVHAADDADRAGVHVGARARRGVRPDEPDLDRPRGHGGRGRRPSRPDGRDGRRAGATSAAGRRCSRDSAGGDGRGASGRVVQSGETVEVGPDDLLVRPVDGALAVEAPTGGTIVADSVWAHLAGARHLEADVRALLDRVASQEVRA